MKVFVVSKNSDSVEGRGPSYPVAVVLDDSGIEFPYSASEYTVIASKDQPKAMKAFAEVSKLSEDAKQEMGITFNAIAKLKELADPDVNVKTGSTLWASLYHGEDGMAPARITGVYSWERKDDSFERPEPLKVFRDLQGYLDNDKKQAIAKEVSGVSAETKKLLQNLKF